MGAMKIVYMGTSEFAVPPLRSLIDCGRGVELVVTQPDRPAGRGQKLHVSPVKAFAIERGLPLFQPEDLHSVEALQCLSQISPDIIVVASYGVILKKEVRSLAKTLCMNIHASLLPAYRGASPIASALMNEEAITGTTIFKMKARLDSGPVIGMRRCVIDPNDTRGTMEEKLAHLSADLLIETLRAIEKGEYLLIPQEEEFVSYAPKLSKAMGFIQWNLPAEKIHNKIRAFQPSPGAFAYYNVGKKRIKVDIIESAFVEESHPAQPGQILRLSADGIDVACGEAGALQVKRLQPEGKRPMTALEFANGYRIKPGNNFE